MNYGEYVKKHFDGEAVLKKADVVWTDDIMNDCKKIISRNVLHPLSEEERYALIEMLLNQRVYSTGCCKFFNTTSDGQQYEVAQINNGKWSYTTSQSIKEITSPKANPDNQYIINTDMSKDKSLRQLMYETYGDLGPTGSDFVIENTIGIVVEPKDKSDELEQQVLELKLTTLEITKAFGQLTNNMNKLCDIIERGFGEWASKNQQKI